jgi:tRNA (cmo5U34)-methyltransferase
MGLVANRRFRSRCFVCKMGARSFGSPTRMPSPDSAAKFDTHRAAEYEQQSRIALAGYDACHELSTCLLAASLGERPAHLLIAGAGGTGREILTAGAFESRWQFTAVDPSQAMLDLAMSRVAAAGLQARTRAVLGRVEDLPADAAYDAATLIGVLHHLPGAAAKRDILQALAARLKPGAPFILACNRCAYESQPLLLAAWAQRWRMQGAEADEVNAKLARIRQGADPPESEEAVVGQLADAGLGKTVRFFSSLFWSAWIAFRA